MKKIINCVALFSLVGMQPIYSMDGNENMNFNTPSETQKEQQSKYTFDKFLQFALIERSINNFPVAQLFLKPLGQDTQFEQKCIRKKKFVTLDPKQIEGKNCSVMVFGTNDKKLAEILYNNYVKK